MILSDSCTIVSRSILLCFTRPYLFFYKLIPIATPLILILLADKYRMFDLSLHYRPVMTAVFYALTTLNVIATVYLSRAALYIMYKKEGTPHMANNLTVFFHTLIWTAIIIGGTYTFSYLTQWVYASVKNPSIIKYDETYATLIKHVIPPLLLLLAFLWNFTALVPALIASKSISLYTAIRRSCSIISTHLVPFILIWFFFGCLDLLPIFTPLSIPRRYILLKQIIPYVLELVITTCTTVAYAVFYKMYKQDI